MAADDHLNPAQFRFVKDSPLADNGVRGSANDHRLRLYQGAKKQVLGSIRWDQGTGEVKALGVQKLHQRKGLANRLWDRASEHSAENGLAMPAHSHIQLPDGEKWAAAEESRNITRPISGQQPLFPRKGANRTRIMKEKG